MGNATEVSYEIDHKIEQVIVEPANTWEVLSGTKLPNNYQAEEKRKRGRPKKFRPGTGNKTIHKIETLPPPKQLSNSVIDEMHKEFKKFYGLHKLALRIAIIEICKKFNISYSQAYTTLKSDI